MITGPFSEKRQPPGVADAANNRRTRILYRLLPVILLLFACALGPPHAWPEVPFQNEFDNICSRTADASALSINELETLIERCDKLRPVIEKAGEPERKIYLKRLRMCRDLFAYVLDSKKAESDGKK